MIHLNSLSLSLSIYLNIRSVVYLKVKHSNTGNPVFRLLHMLFLASEVREIEISESFLTYNDVSL